MGMGYISCRPDETEDDLLSASYEIEIGGVRWAAGASLAAMYDPTSSRMRT